MLSPEADKVKPEKLQLDSFLEVNCLNSGCSGLFDFIKFSFQQLHPRTAILQDSEDVECSFCSLAAAVHELDPSNVQFTVAEHEREIVSFVIVWSNPIYPAFRVEYIFN